MFELFEDVSKPSPCIDVQPEKKIAITIIMKRKDPTPIDDTWYFRGQMMKNVMKLYEGEYRWHKIQNCPRCKLKKGIKPCLWGYPDAEVAQTGKYAIMGCTL